MLKWFFAIGLAGVLLLVAFVFYVYSNLDGFVEQAIEEYGSQAVGVAVLVDHVELDLERGRASVYGLEVANPDGFEGPTAFTLGEITIDIDLESLQEGKLIVLDEIKIEALVVFFELNAARQSNLDVLRANATASDAASSEEERSGIETPPTRLRIRKLRFADGRLEADTRAIGGNKTDAKLATAELSDIGGSSGATGSEIGVILVQELSRQAATAIGRGQVDKLLDRHLGGKEADAAKGLLDRFKR